ncbi:MAG: hypothetical protein AAGC60_20085 [Acidobacteriota bacterium]
MGLQRQIDRSVIEVGEFDDSAERRAYWHARTPAERMAAIEELRRINYGEHATSRRLQRVLEVAERMDEGYQAEAKTPSLSRLGPKPISTTGRENAVNFRS